MTASVAVTIARREVIEKHPVWVAVYLVATLVSAIVGGLVVSGWASVASTLVFALPLFYFGLRGFKAVRRIEHYPPT